MNNSTKILLLSSSRVGAQEFLAHALDPIARTLGHVTEIVFVPYALGDLEGYTRLVADALRASGLVVRGLHTYASPRRALAEAEAVFVGGGNTFRLLAALEGLEALPVLRERAGRDLVYVGSSAGTNLACPTIRTTNDMPIVEPKSFAALGLVPFQINPHFVGGNPFPGHRGETREERIAQFHEVADVAVVGLPEPSWLEVSGDGDRTQARVGGQAPAVVFEPGIEARSIAPGTTFVGETATGHVRLDLPIDSPNRRP